MTVGDLIAHHSVDTITEELMPSLRREAAHRLAADLMGEASSSEDVLSMLEGMSNEKVEEILDLLVDEGHEAG